MCAYVRARNNSFIFTYVLVYFFSLHYQTELCDACINHINIIYVQNQKSFNTAFECVKFNLKREKKIERCLFYPNYICVCVCDRMYKQTKPKDKKTKSNLI